MPIGTRKLVTAFPEFHHVIYHPQSHYTLGLDWLTGARVPLPGRVSSVSLLHSARLAVRARRSLPGLPRASLLVSAGRLVGGGASSRRLMQRGSHCCPHSQQRRHGYRLPLSLCVSCGPPLWPMAQAGCHSDMLGQADLELSPFVF